MPAQMDKDSVFPIGAGAIGLTARSQEKFVCRECALNSTPT
jgi:hypothetical protein